MTMVVINFLEMQPFLHRITAFFDAETIKSSSSLYIIFTYKVGPYWL